MSRVYDNWQRLVEAVLKREDFKRIALCESFNSSNISSRCSSDSSDEDVSDFPDGVTPYFWELKINDLAGAGIVGILYKWVNYGKGWRPRWFVLQDGVFSYYKIHGPDRIVVNVETEKGSKVVGEESMRRIARQHSNDHHSHHKNGNSSSSVRSRKPIGEVHLKVSSIRESRSDDKRFSIFTGTNTLHLRAESREDKLAWMEALQDAKDMLHAAVS